eukprot:1607463-Pyramimonas_sp.AAC.1
MRDKGAPYGDNPPASCSRLGPPYGPRRGLRGPQEGSKGAPRRLPQVGSGPKEAPRVPREARTACTPPCADISQPP